MPYHTFTTEEKKITQIMKKNNQFMLTCIDLNIYLIIISCLKVNVTSSMLQEYHSMEIKFTVCTIKSVKSYEYA